MRFCCLHRDDINRILYRPNVDMPVEMMSDLPISATFFISGEFTRSIEDIL
jgi:hypothetical protein